MTKAVGGLGGGAAPLPPNQNNALPQRVVRQAQTPP
jgi:hypothetical protein